MTARRLLDQVHSLAQLEAFASVPETYAAQLATELSPARTIAELEARDAQLTGALGELDTMLARAMRIRLEHTLATDTSLGAPTRKVFATTILRYASDLGLLAERVREQATRGRARDPEAIATAVVSDARWVLDLRDRVRAGVLETIRDACKASVADADRRARDRNSDDAARKRWSAVRRELEAIALDPARVSHASWAERLASHDEQIDEPEPQPEVTFADMIEID